MMDRTTPGEVNCGSCYHYSGMRCGYCLRCSALTQRVDGGTNGLAGVVALQPCAQQCSCVPWKHSTMCPWILLGCSSSVLSTGTRPLLPPSIAPMLVLGAPGWDVWFGLDLAQGPASSPMAQSSGPSFSQAGFRAEFLHSGS